MRTSVGFSSTPSTARKGSSAASSMALPMPAPISTNVVSSMGAAGPSQFIVALNGRIRSFNKFTGVADGGIEANSDVFFQSVLTPPATNNFTSDPRIRYDRLSGRWFITIIDVPGMAGTLSNRVLLAVSDSSFISASSVWSFFHFLGDSSKFADYPTLGLDANALYIGVNIFGTRRVGTTFNGTTAFVVRKSSVLGAGPIVEDGARSRFVSAGAGATSA